MVTSDLDLQRQQYCGSFISAYRATRILSDNEVQHQQSLYRFSDEAITPGNFDLLSELVAPNYIIHSPLGDLDLQALKSFMQPLRNALTNFEMSRQQVITEGDFAATRTTITGVFNNDFLNPNGVIPANGRDIEVQVINVFKFNEDGKIVEEWLQFDNLSFLTQLGVMAPPTQS